MPVIYQTVPGSQTAVTMEYVMGPQMNQYVCVMVLGLVLHVMTPVFMARQ